ncbi:MAG: hypothetical protein NBV60_04820 [Erythrobacter sp.]|nr:hypothetical protein [Erythrobacter sp.]
MRFIVASFAILLASCGPDLGTHQLVSARNASELPAEVRHSRNDPGYVVLTFSTNADLNDENINALYANAGACNGADAGRMTAFGPFTDAAVPKELPLRGDPAPVSRYLVYIPVTGEAWGDLGKDGRTPVIGTFDLARNTQDVCFYLEHTGYPVATRTGMVRVAAPVLKRAIGAPVP